MQSSTYNFLLNPYPSILTLWTSLQEVTLGLTIATLCRLNRSPQVTQLPTYIVFILYKLNNKDHDNINL
jgi:hypothetical protein